jgi:hypothetical protein
LHTTVGHVSGGWVAERMADAPFIDAETVREHRRLCNCLSGNKLNL